LKQFNCYLKNLKQKLIQIKKKMSIRLKNQHITNMYTPIELVTTNLAWHHDGGGGVTDHGYLHGLGDNDHPQYFLASRSTVFMTSANMSNYQLTANNSLSLGTEAIQSFLHTSLSSGWLAVTNSGAFAPSDHTHTIDGGAASDHSHGNVIITSTGGTLLNIQSASNGLTVAMPNYVTTAYGAALQGSGAYNQNTGTIQFVNSNGVTFGLSENGVMTASIPAVGGAQTGISGIAGSGASTVSDGTVQFGNANGISFGLNSNTMTASYTVPGVTVFSNSNNIEFGLSGSTITALANFAQSTQTQNLHNVTLSGNTAGTMTQISSGTLTLAGGNNITLSQSGNKVSIIGAQQGHNVTLGGNTSGTLTQVSSGTLTLAGGDNITLSQDGNAITISGAVQGGVQTGISGIGASNTTYNSGTVIWSGQNNITIGSFANAGSQYVRLSVGNYLTTAADLAHTHGPFATYTTSGTNILVSSYFSGLNLYVPKFITTAPLSQNTSNYAGISTGSQSTAGSDIGVTLNTAGLNLAIPKFVTNTAAGAHTHGSNVSLSLTNLSGAASSASNGLTISMTGYPATSFVNVTDAGSLYFGGGSNIWWDSSVDGMSTTIMATAGGGSGGGGGIAAAFSGNVSGTTQVISGGTVRFVGGNNITLSQAGSIVTISAGASGAAPGWVTGATAGSNISIGTGGTNTLYVPAYLTTATGLVNTGFTTTATNGSIVLGTLNSLGLKLAVPPYLTAGGAGGQVTFSAGVSSAALSSLVFGNSNGLSFGLNGSTITAAAQSGVVSFIDGGGITWGTSMGSNSLVTAVTATVVGGTGGGSSYVFSNSNNVTFGLSNNTVTASATMSIPQASIFFADSNGHSFSSSVNGVSTTIYIVT
jgi:fibronectin-binding autotransporter adhesin